MKTLIDTIPTGAIYGIHAAQETRAQGLPAIDVRSPVGDLRYDPLEHTAVTPQHGRLVGFLSDSPLDMFACIGGATKLLFERKVFEATPSAIEGARAATAYMMPERLSDPPAYESFKALGRWLDADDAAVADMVGVGRTTPYTWKRDGREPRAATAQRIYEYHATLDSLSRRLGAGGLRRWLREGMPPHRDTLLAGDLERLEADVHALLFRREPARRVDLAAAPEDTSPIELAGERPLRPSGRRPRAPRG